MKLSIIITALILCGCSSLSGNCVPRAIYQGSARALQLGQDVKFAVSHVSKGVDHIQCLYLEDGTWKWSAQDGDLIFHGNKDFSVEPYKYLTWSELQKELEGKFK